MVQPPEESLPSFQKAIVIEKTTPSSDPTTWYPISLQQRPLTKPLTSEDQLTIKIEAFAFNHRDIWIRKGLYPSILSNSILGSDCSGKVVGPIDHPFYGTRVVIYPAVNWIDESRGPDLLDQSFGILGGTALTNGVGTFAEFINVPSSHCISVPKHLFHQPQSSASIPLAGLTAFRALFTKAEMKIGQKLLVTGIGGGVAIFILQFAVAMGIKVWVTSGSDEKLKLAQELGAKGGVNYKEGM